MNQAASESVSCCCLYLVPPLPSQALSEVESGDLVQQERARKAAVRKSKVDADLDAESADLMEKKGVTVSIHVSINFVHN